MALSDPGRIREHWSRGRGFTSTDPERQGEVVGYVRTTPIEMAPTQRPASRGSRLDWLRVQDREAQNFEGSSSRRGR